MSEAVDSCHGIGMGHLPCGPFSITAGCGRANQALGYSSSSHCFSRLVMLTQSWQQVDFKAGKQWVHSPCQYCHRYLFKQEVCVCVLIAPPPPRYAYRSLCSGGYSQSRIVWLCGVTFILHLCCTRIPAFSSHVVTFYFNMLALLHTPRDRQPPIPPLPAPV